MGKKLPGVVALETAPATKKNLIFFFLILEKIKKVGLPKCRLACRAALKVMQDNFDQSPFFSIGSFSLYS